MLFCSAHFSAVPGLLRRPQVVRAQARAFLRASAPGRAGCEIEAAGVFGGDHENNVGSEFKNAGALCLDLVVCGNKLVEHVDSGPFAFPTAHLSGVYTPWWAGGRDRNFYY